MSVSHDGARRRALATATATATAIALCALAAPAFAGQANLAGLQSAESHDRFIVTYRAGTAERADVARARASAARSSLQHLRRTGLGADVVKTGARLDRVQAEALMRQLAANPNVEHVEVDQRMKPLITPNDTYYAQYQWHYFGAAGGIRADQAWDVANGAGVVVAVLDTGITSHSDLAANLLPGYDFISDTAMARDGNGRDGNPRDEGDWAAAGECYSGSPGGNSSWHGTHVAGTVAAVTNNAKGMAGVAHGAKVVPVRVLGKCGGYTSDIADAIVWASGGTVSGIAANANPAEVINMSLGGSGACSATYQNAINSAVARGTTVVVAAGNSNVNVANAVPANCANVIAVAATDSAGQRSGFSNYGAGIDIAAPGSSIASTLNSGTTVPGTEGYAVYNGTSMAAPHVAGVVALVQSVASIPKTPAEMESLLKASARVFPVVPSQSIGAGILNARAAVDAAKAPPAVVAGQAYANGNNYAIYDRKTTSSPISVGGRTGNAPSNASVTVNIVHTYVGDLKIDLVAPDGTPYNLRSYTGGSADNINATYALNLSSEALNGTWSLRVYDARKGDAGYIDGWSITF